MARDVDDVEDLFGAIEVVENVGRKQSLGVLLTTVKEITVYPH